MKEEIKITKEDLVMWLDRPPSDDDFDLCSFLAKAVENQKKYYEENKSLQSQLKAKEEVIKEAREETKQWIGYYEMKAKERYDQNTSVFVNSTCKKGYVMDVVSKLTIIDLILSKGENK